MLYSRFCRPDTIPYPDDGYIQPEYAKVLQDDGTFSVEKVGEIDTRVLINAAKDSCNIYNIIDRYQKGDLDALNKVKGFYGDVRGLPSSLMEAYQYMDNAQKKFNSLPAEIKREFNYDSKQFIARATDERTKDVFMNYIKSHNPIFKEKEIVTDVDAQ